MLFENQNQTQNLSCTGHKNIQLTQDAKLIQVLLHPFIKKINFVKKQTENTIFSFTGDRLKKSLSWIKIKSNTDSMSEVIFPS